LGVPALRGLRAVGLLALSFTAFAALRPQKDAAAIPHAAPGNSIGREMLLAQ